MSLSQITVEPLRILIVDDEPDNRELLKMILRWEGFCTECASGGAAALAYLAGHTADVVLLDLMMPGMNGYEVTERIRQNPATTHIPVLIVSAMHDEATRLRAQQAGASDFLTKPMERLELCARVRSALPGGRSVQRPPG